MMSLLLSVSSSAAAPKLTVFILMDDLGLNEMSFNNNTRGLITPNLEALAQGGVRLSHYYTTPLCSPTRGALLTGRYSHKIGLQSNVIYWDTPWGLPLEEQLMPQVFKNVTGGLGRTAMFGKWHLGRHANASLPSNRGFDLHEGYFQGCKSEATHVAACCASPKNASDFLDFVCDSTGTDYRGADWFRGETFAGVEANNTPSSLLIAALAEKVIAEFASGVAPGFLYLPFQNIHAPYDALWENVQLFNGLGLTLQQQTMFAYIKELDDAVGRVVAAIKNAGLEDDAVIIAVSDNGAPNADGVLDRNWPLRGFKSQVFEGGTRVPALIYAPGRLPAGVTVDSMFHVTDWLPTLVNMWGGAALSGIDGVDQSGTLAGGAAARDELVVNVDHVTDSNTQFARPSAAIRVGDLKLICWQFTAAGIAGATKTGCAGDPNHPAEWPQVYNVTVDPSEVNNIAPSLPASTMTMLLTRMVALAGPGAASEPMIWVQPYQGPDYYCADCPLRNKTGPYEPWTPWLPDPARV